MDVRKTHTQSNSKQKQQQMIHHCNIQWCCR